MKNINLSIFGLLLSSFLVLACSPQDPAVLTRDEKAKEAAKRSGKPYSQNSGGSQAGGSGRGPGLAPQSDLAGASYLLDRQSEVLGYLALGLKLVDSQAVLNLDPCLRVVELDQTQDSASYAIDQVNCRKNFGPSTQVSKGRIYLSLKWDSQKSLTSLDVQSHPKGEDSLLDSRTSLSSSFIKGRRVELKDQLKIQLKKISDLPLVFRLIQATASTEVGVSMKDTEQHYLKMQTWGDVQIEVQEKGLVFSHTLSSVLRYDAKTSEAKTSYYELSLSSSKTKGAFSNKETLLLGACATREGDALIQFDFRPELSRRGHIVKYSSGKISITDQRAPERVSEINLPACDLQIAAATVQLPSVRWSPLFIY